MHIMKLLLTHFKYFYTIHHRLCELQCVSCGPMGRHENGEMWMRNELRRLPFGSPGWVCAPCTHCVRKELLLGRLRRNGKQRLFMFNNKIYFTTLMREWNVGEITFFLVFFFLFFFFAVLRLVYYIGLNVSDSIEIQYQYTRWIMKFHTNDSLSLSAEAN